MGLWFCRSLCHYGLLLVCLREDVCMCVCWWGRGSGGMEASPPCLVGRSIAASLSPYCCRWTQSEPIHPLRLDPQIPSSGQQRDYGRNRLIYFCEFTYAKCLPHKPWHQSDLRKQKTVKYCFVFSSSKAALFLYFMLCVQSKERKKERKCCTSNLRAFCFLYLGYLRRNTGLVRGHLQ